MARYSLLSPCPHEALGFTNALERAGRAVRVARRGLSGAYGLTVAEWRMLRALRPPRNSTGPQCRRGRGPGTERRRARAPHAHLAPGRAPDRDRPRARGSAAVREARWRSPPAPGVPHSRRRALAGTAGIDNAHAAARDDQQHFPLLARAPDRGIDPVVGPAAVLPVRPSRVPPRAEGGRTSTQNPSTRLTTFLRGAPGAGQRGRCARRSKTESWSTTLTNFSADSVRPLPRSRDTGD